MLLFSIWIFFLLLSLVSRVIVVVFIYFIYFYILFVFSYENGDVNCYHIFVLTHISPAGYPIFAGEDEGDQLALIMEVLGMPPQSLLDVSKRARHFISSKGYPRYCSVTMQPDGTVMLGPGKSKRGKHRGTPGTRDLVKSALKGTYCFVILSLFFVQFLYWHYCPLSLSSVALRQ